MGASRRKTTKPEPEQVCRIPAGIMVAGQLPRGMAPPRLQAVRGRLGEVLDQLTEHVGTTLVHCGMAPGVDTMFAELAFARSMRLIAHVPFRGQDQMWPQSTKLHYRMILGSAFEVRCYSESLRYPGPQVYLIQATKLVSEAQAGIVVWGDELTSPLAPRAVAELRLGDRPWMHLNPVTLRVVRYRGADRTETSFSGS